MVAHRYDEFVRRPSAPQSSSALADRAEPTYREVTDESEVPMKRHQPGRPRRQPLFVGIVAAAIASCGSSDGGSGSATPTCTTAAGSTITLPATTDRAEQANTGLFTFDVVCERFGTCACTAALSEPLTTTISFSDQGVAFTDNSGTTMVYPRDPAGGFRLTSDSGEKAWTINFTQTGFVFEMTLAGAPCSLQTYTRR
jgi:hypothetical protein